MIGRLVLGNAVRYSSVLVVGVIGVLTIIGSGAPNQSNVRQSELELGSVQVPGDLKEKTRDVQQFLTDKGYDPGPVDGMMGRRTSSAIRSYQENNGLNITGQVSNELYLHLAPKPEERKKSTTLVYGQPAGGIDDPGYRASISRNVAIAKVDSSCKGLFVPKIKKEMFRNIIPIWNVYFLNNSQYRYNVHYDISYRKAGRTYYGAYNEILTQENSATVRPRKLVQLPVMKGESDIKEITELNVFHCDRR